MNNICKKENGSYLIYLGSNTILYIMRLYRYYLEKLDMEIREGRNVSLNRREWRRAKKSLERLRNLFGLAKCKPLLAKYRSSDWFCSKSKVRCLVERRFIPAEIVAEGSDNSGGLVILVAHNDLIILKEGVDEYKDYPLNSPLIMQEWEYQYFKKYPNFARFWLKESSADPEIAKIFLTALKC